mmetsp:Transcript_55441/g.75720  ORF Transcript_55441/g.75720 Transcript_55441/m.75720 type:complete len:391 (-) Transcript_55441:859-2031(-)
MTRLVYAFEWFSDEQSFFYDWSAIQPYRWDNWRTSLSQAAQRFSIRLPASWLGSASDPLPACGSSNAKRLRRAAMDRLTTSSGLLDSHRNPCLKFLWFCVCNELSKPLSDDSICIYMAFLYEHRSNLGAITDFLHGTSFLIQYQSDPNRTLLETDTTKFEFSSRVRALKKSFKSEFKSCPRTTLGLEPFMVSDILFVYVESSCLAWRIAVGCSVAVTFKLCMRFDCASRLRWDDSYCVITSSYIRFYLDGCKNLQYSGRWCDVAKPSDQSFGVYHALCKGKRIFQSGFVLSRIIKGTNGVHAVDTSAPMSREQFVAHSRAALSVIGISSDLVELFTAKSSRIGAASAAVTAQLSPADISFLSRTRSTNWVSYYDEKNLAQRLRVNQAIGC